MKELENLGTDQITRKLNFDRVRYDTEVKPNIRVLSKIHSVQRTPNNERKRFNSTKNSKTDSIGPKKRLIRNISKNKIKFSNILSDSKCQKIIKNANGFPVKTKLCFTRKVSMDYDNDTPCFRMPSF